MLYGSKILLRKPEIKDVDFILKIENDEKYWCLSGNTSPYSENDIKNFIITSTFDLFTDLQTRFVIEEKEYKQQVGLIDLFFYNKKNNDVACGIFVCENHRRKNYALESLEIIKNHVFNDLNIQTIWCTIHSDNDASLNLFKKANFSQSKIAKTVLKNNLPVDEIKFQISKPINKK